MTGSLYLFSIKCLPKTGLHIAVCSLSVVLSSKKCSNVKKQAISACNSSIALDYQDTAYCACLLFCHIELKEHSSSRNKGVPCLGQVFSESSETEGGQGEGQVAHSSLGFTSHPVFHLFPVARRCSLPLQSPSKSTPYAGPCWWGTRPVKCQEWKEGENGHFFSTPCPGCCSCCGLFICKWALIHTLQWKPGGCSGGNFHLPHNHVNPCLRFNKINFSLVIKDLGELFIQIGAFYLDL